MERVDFCSVIGIIREYISEDRGIDQVELIYKLFRSFSDENEFVFDNGLVCRWINGYAKVSPRVTAYYLDPQHTHELTEDITSDIIPLMFDAPMAYKRIVALVSQDITISEEKRTELTSAAPSDSPVLFSRVLLYGMERNFIKRPHKNDLLPKEGMSPAAQGYVLSADLPKPCRHFCGREDELRSLDDMLSANSHIFIRGIAGIGKSELAKAYAWSHKNRYTILAAENNCRFLD